MPELRFHLDGSDRPIALTPTVAGIAGYTGRDQASVRRHVEELAAQGIAPPPQVPMLYPLTPDRLALATPGGPPFAVLGEETSGEAEFVLVLAGGELYIGVGSDHTDRRVERFDVPAAKQVCPKFLGPTLWRLRDLEDHWDALRLRSWTGPEHQPYQEGSVAAILPPRDILALVQARSAVPLTAAVFFCGTLPLLGNTFRYTTKFAAELFDPVLDRRLTCAYQLEPVRWLRA